MPGIPPIDPYPMPASGGIPTNTADWSIDPHRVVLLIHDMQRYFLKPFPAGESPTNELIRNTALLRGSCVELGVPIAYTAQPGGMTEKQRGLLKDFWGPGMRMDPDDRKVIDALEPDPEDWVFTKWRYSAFFGSDLLEQMRKHGRDQLLISGVYAHVGVLATALDAFTNDIQTFLVSDAVADFSESFHRFALTYAAQRCSVVVTAKAALTQLQTPTTRMVTDKERS